MNNSRTERMREHFDNISPVYYDIVDRLWYDAGYYHKQELSEVRKRLSTGTLRVLDAGCGPGRHSLSLLELNHDVIAMDLSKEMLIRLRDNATQNQRKLHLVQADTRFLPFRDTTLDAIISIEVLEHLPGGIIDCKMVSKEFSRILKEGGTALVEVPLRSHGYLRLLYRKKPTWREVSGEERDRYYVDKPLLYERFFLEKEVLPLFTKNSFKLRGRRYIRVVPSGLVEQYPILNSLDIVVERFPLLKRFGREVIWRFEKEEV